jgi:hypothetical protein
MNWKGCGRKLSWPNLRHGEAEEDHTKPQSVKPSLGRDLNPRPPEYEAVDLFDCDVLCVGDAGFAGYNVSLVISFEPGH